MEDIGDAATNAIAAFQIGIPENQDDLQMGV